MEKVENSILLTAEEYATLAKKAVKEEKPKAEKQPLHTSKRVLYIDLVIAVIVTAAVIIGELTGHDMTSSAVVAGLWDAQLAAYGGWYLWKSKNENRSKHAMALIRELADKYGIESVARIAEIVLKD